ncbi:hypothetical protein [Sphingomonas sp. BK345]|uniref:hypothetical protein n=1 Tax=Sphingomonas sp. BK345 TaxID=2586980 RepID=UPI00160D6D25|nr:hypothetical protein [Sphingomonas sp. BK345]MBB3475161.1 hypothetical protein [Sphingomonas sp. BK345]
MGQRGILDAGDALQRLGDVAAGQLADVLGDDMVGVALDPCALLRLARTPVTTKSPPPTALLPLPGSAVPWSSLGTVTPLAVPCC